MEWWEIWAQVYKIVTRLKNGDNIPMASEIVQTQMNRLNIISDSVENEAELDLMAHAFEDLEEYIMSTYAAVG